MKSGSLRLRVAIVTLLVVALSLAGFATFVTIRYREGLRADLRNKVMLGATVLRHTPAKLLKQAVHTLALQGIGVELRGIQQPVTKPGARPGPAGAAQVPPQKPATVEEKRGVLRLEEILSTEGIFSPHIQERHGVSAIATLSADASGTDNSVSQLVTAELVGGLAVMLAVALLLAWWLRLALAPLEHVGRVAGRIASGARGQRLNPRRADTDLGRMAASFDAMVVALDTAAARAEASEAAMRTFLASAAHELRAPLAALQATVETLLREQPARPERDRLEARLARECSRMGRLVQDLLDLARLEAADAAVQQQVDLDSVVAAAVADCTSEEASTAIRHEGETAMVLGDPTALSGAVRNLLENAITAAGASGNVTVHVGTDAEHAVVKVSDDGPGVPSDERQAIFEPFTRLNSSPDGHTGLGLAIVDRVMRQHGGSVSCDDVEHGARFTLRLPARQAPGSGAGPEDVLKNEADSAALQL